MEPCHGSVRASPPGGRQDDPTPAPELLREMQPALKPIERFGGRVRLLRRCTAVQAGGVEIVDACDMQCCSPRTLRLCSRW